MTPLPIELTCNVTGIVIAWIVNDTNYNVVQLINRALPGHELAGTNLLVNSPVNNTKYICVFVNDGGNETYSDPAYVVIAGKHIKYKLYNMYKQEYFAWYMCTMPEGTQYPMVSACNISGKAWVPIV